MNEFVARNGLIIKNLVNSTGNTLILTTDNVNDGTVKYKNMIDLVGSSGTSGSGTSGTSGSGSSGISGMHGAMSDVWIYNSSLVYSGFTTNNINPSQITSITINSEMCIHKIDASAFLNTFLTNDYIQLTKESDSAQHSYYKITSTNSSVGPPTGAIFNVDFIDGANGKLGTTNYVISFNKSGPSGTSGTSGTLADDSVTYPKFNTTLTSVTGLTSLTGVTIDWSEAGIFSLTGTTGTTFTFINLQLNKIITLLMLGNVSVTLPTYCKKIGGTYSVSSLNYMQFHCTNSTGGSEQVWYSINQAL